MLKIPPKSHTKKGAFDGRHDGPGRAGARANQN